jgi:hypothetical protein
MVHPRTDRHLGAFRRFLEQGRPVSILEIGPTDGGIGGVARDYLDSLQPRDPSGGRRAGRLDGIDAFAGGALGRADHLYDALYTADAPVAIDALDALGDYDLVVLVDVLDRLEKPDAQALIDAGIAHAAQGLVLLLPLGKTWPGNRPSDLGGWPRRSFWFFEDFSRFAAQRAVYDYPNGPYAVFLVLKEDYIDYRMKEWKKAGASPAGGGGGLRERLGLGVGSVDRIDLRPLSRHVANEEHLRYFLDTRFREHYRLLAYLSTLFRGSFLFDVGTNKGYSALALAYSPVNTVISYDLVECTELRDRQALERVEFRLGDALADPRLLASPLIVLDTDHDGVFEERVYRHLKANGYSGLLFLDDIHLNCAMIRFWAGITDSKADLTDLGHLSGSGLVEFGRGNGVCQ